jgi:hypothetical protein
MGRPPVKTFRLGLNKGRWRDKRIKRAFGGLTSANYGLYLRKNGNFRPVSMANRQIRCATLPQAYAEDVHV